MSRPASASLISSKNASVHRYIPAKVNVDHTVPLLVVHLGEFRIDIQAGIVDEHIDRAQRIDHVLTQVVDAITISHIGLDCNGCSSFRLDLVDGLVCGLFRGPVVHSDVRAIPTELLGDSASDPFDAPVTTQFLLSRVMAFTHKFGDDLHRCLWILISLSGQLLGAWFRR